MSVATSPRPTYQCVVITEEPEDRQQITDALVSAGFITRDYACWSEAIADLKAIKPDVIIVDEESRNPKCSEIFRQIKSIHTLVMVPIIYITHDLKSTSWLDNFTLNGIGYIGRPFISAEIAYRIHVILDYQQHERQDVADRVPSADLNSQELQLLNQAMALLCNDLAHPPDAKTLAQQLEISPNYLAGLFNRGFNLSLPRWLREKRLNIAFRLLVGSNLPIGEISRIIGYQTQTNFSRAFREQFNTTPREAREK
jgi:AraC-like DNA-binding protein